MAWGIEWWVWVAAWGIEVVAYTLASELDTVDHMGNRRVVVMWTFVECSNTYSMYQPCLSILRFLFSGFLIDYSIQRTVAVVFLLPLQSRMSPCKSQVCVHQILHKGTIYYSSKYIVTSVPDSGFLLLVSLSPIESGEFNSIIV